MSEMLTKVIQTWDELKSRSQSSQTAAIREGLYSRFHSNLFLGYDVASQAPLLLLRSRSEIAERIKFPKERDWFTASTRYFEDKQGRDLNLALELTDPDYFNMFAALVACIVDDVRAVRTPKQQAAEFNRSLKKWCRSFDKIVDEPLTRPKQRGLYAELWFLRRHVIPRIGPDAAVNYWVGPSGKDHDFQFPRCGVEVKATSASSEDPEIRISNEFQLDSVRRDNARSAESEHDLKLFLFCLFLSEDEGGDDESADLETERDLSLPAGAERDDGETLFQMVEGARSDLSESKQARSEFRTKLARAGYVEKHEEEYKRFRRKVVDVARPSFYEVADHNDAERFPRIIRSNLLGTGRQLPDAVTKVRYFLRLEEIRGFGTEEDFVFVHFTENEE